MRKACFVVALTAFALACNAAWATRVTINGTYSRAQVKKDCDAVGGSCDNCSGKSGGYSCSNLNNNNTVYCLSNGRCTGWIPRRSHPPHTLSGILRAPSGVKTIGRVTKHGVRPVKAGDLKARHLGHGRVVKTAGFKNKTIYRRSTGPTNPNGPDVPGKDKGPFTSPQHHGMSMGGGRHR
jgi:hypothetical protein